MRFLYFLGMSVLAAPLVGCSGGPGRIGSPDVNARRAAERAIQQLDQDQDGVLDQQELADCPALLHALDAYDEDKNRQLSIAEIEGGIARWAATRSGALMLPIRLQLNGRPLSGAEVKLIPVEFLQEEVKQAGATTDAYGSGMLGLAQEDRPSNAPPTPLAPPGLYRVEITHPSVDVPAEFNTESTLGLETFVASRNPSGVVWDLRVKKNQP